MSTYFRALWHAIEEGEIYYDETNKYDIEFTAAVLVYYCPDEKGTESYDLPDLLGQKHYQHVTFLAPMKRGLKVMANHLDDPGHVVIMLHSLPR